MASLAALIFGLVVGSFLNVCIHRIPQGLSIVRPRSRCPRCQAPIRAFDNIPLLSFVLLRGRCRNCGARISWIYPAVELLSGLAFLWGYLRFGLSVPGAKFVLLAALLIVLIFTDLEERLLPDRVTFVGLGCGLLFSLLLPVGDGTTAWFIGRTLAVALPALGASLGDALLGAAAGAGLLFLVGELYYQVRKVEGMGLGDVKLMAMVGSFLGLKLTLLSIFLGSFAGSVIGMAYIKLAGKTSKYELPFGSFLGVGALVTALWGLEMLRWYRELWGL